MTETNDDYKAVISDELRALARRLDSIRKALDALNTERGVPIKNTVSRVNKAAEYISGAREYWQHDVVNGNAKLTKSEMQKAEQFELS